MSKASTLVGMVGKETNGKLWARGSLWKIDGEGENQFLCNECSEKELRNRMKIVIKELHRILTNEEVETVLEKLRDPQVSDEIGPIGPLEEIPKKYENELYTEELDWLYRFGPDAMMVCERCKRTVI